MPISHLTFAMSKLKTALLIIITQLIIIMTGRCKNIVILLVGGPVVGVEGI